MQRIIDAHQNNNPIPIEDIRRNILKSAHDTFSHVLGETRRASNDVTLWDHSYSVASLYKATLAKILMEYEYSNDKSNYHLPDPGKLEWRILAVNFDRLHFIMKGLKIGDIKGRQEIIEKILKEIKSFIEFKYPLGNEIYRDETGIYFVIPDLSPKCPDCKEDLNFKAILQSDLKNFLQKGIIDIFQKKLDGEIIPKVEISSNATRSLTLLGTMIEYAKKGLKPYVTPKWVKDWEDIKTKGSLYVVFDKKACDLSDCEHYQYQNENCKFKKVQAEVCPICGIRPKCEKQDLCKRCAEWRDRRLKEWLNTINSNKEMTIWLDEVSDLNNRIAVIRGRFNLTKWLNGENLYTMFSQFLTDYWKESTKYINKDKEAYDSLKHVEVRYHDLKNDVQDLLNDLNKKCNETIINNISEACRKQKLDDFIEAIVTERDTLGIKDIKTNPEPLILFLFKKHASPARLRRIWNTTNKFWDSVLKNLKKNENGLFTEDLKVKDYNDKKRKLLEDLRCKRIHIKLDGFKNRSGLYNAKVDGSIEFEWYWDKDKKELISICNLQILFGDRDFESVKELCNDLKEKEVELINKTERIESFKIKDAYIGSSYIPIVDILVTPVSFQIVVPAVTALNIIKLIKKKYEKEFSKVRNRLPLYLGIVFSHRKMPLYLCLDTSRRLVTGDEEKKKWKVSNNIQYDVIGYIQFEMEKETIEWEIDMSCGNKNIEDNYYPYYEIEYGYEIMNRPSYFKTFIIEENGKDVKPIELVHSKDLQKDDTVIVTPSYFDFEFLDTCAKRFDMLLKEIDEDYKGNKVKKREHPILGLIKSSPRPYLLEDLEKIEKLWMIINPNKNKLTSSQIKKLEYVCASKIEEWKLKDKNPAESDLYIKFVKSSVENICKDKLKPQEKKIIVQSILSGMFFDVVELFMKIEVKSLSPFDVISSILGDFQYTKEDRKRAEKWILDQIKGDWNANS